MSDYRPLVHGVETLPDGTIAIRIILSGLQSKPVVTHRLSALDAAYVGNQIVRVALSALKAQVDSAAEFPTTDERAR